MYGICEAIDSEKDPECLLLVFHIVESLARLYPGPSSPFSNYIEDIFEILGSYFPIHFTHVRSFNSIICYAFLVLCCVGYSCCIKLFTWYPW